MMVSFKGVHFAKEIILTCVRWYLAYPLSYRQFEEMLQEGGIAVDHSTINRWVLKYAPQLTEAFHRALSTYSPSTESFGRKLHEHLGRNSYATVGRLVTSCQVWNRCRISWR
jgi:hypothetical protein